MAKGSGGKAFTGILCFILGFIIAIVAEVAIIAGGVYWLLNTDLDSIFNTIGIENETTDDEGKTQYVYINTDTSSGGVSTVLDLVSKLQDLAGKGTSMTIGDLTDLLPVADNLVDTVYSAVSEILGVDEDTVRAQIVEEDLKKTPINELTDYLSTAIKGFDISVFTNLLGIDIESSSIYMAMFYGSEAQTITWQGEQYVIYYDVFTLDTSSGNYVRTDGEILDSSLVDYLYTTSSGEYRLYYIVDDNDTEDTSDDKAYVVSRDKSDYAVATSTSGGAQTASISLTSGGTNTTYVEYSIYSEAVATPTGAYYYDENNEIQYLTSGKTIGDLVDNIDDAFNDVYISDLISDETIQNMFDGITIGDLMNDENISDTLLESIYLSDFIDEDADQLLKDMLDGKTLADIMNSDDIVSELFDGIYVTELLDESADDALSSIFDGVYVSDLLNGNFSFDDVAIGDLLGDVTSEDAIMQYLVYGVSGLDFTTPVDSYDVTEEVTNDEGKVTQVTTTYYVFEATYHDYDGNSYPAYVVATLGTNESGDAVYTITDAYYYPITGLDFASTNYTTETIEGVTYYTYTATYTDENNADKTAYVVATLNKDSVYVIQEVYYIGSVTEIDEQGNETTKDNVEIDLKTAASTSVNGINDRITGLQQDLTIGEITDLGDSKLADKLSDYTIDEIDQFINDLTLADVMDVTLGEDSSNLMLYIVYGVSGLDTDNPVSKTTVTTTEGDTTTTVTNYIYKATYNSLGENDKDSTTDITVYVAVEETIVTVGEKTTTTATVTGVYKEASCTTEITGTPVNDVSDRVNGLMNDLTIGEIATNLGTSALANKLSGYTINEIDKFIDELTLADVLGEVDSEDSNIIIYLVYGINELDFTSYDSSYTEDGVTYYVFTAKYHDYDGNSYPAYVVATRSESDDGNGGIVYTYTITEVYYYTDPNDETTKTDATTLVNDISDRIDGLMNDLTIGEIATNLGTSKLATKLSEYTVNEIDQFIEDLTLSDVIEEVTVGEDSSNIMMYIVYGINNLSSYTTYDETVDGVTTTYYVYTATYNTLGTGDENSESDITTVYVKVEENDDGDLVITGVYTDYDTTNRFSTEISGTPVGKVSARVEGLMNDLTIGELIDITDSSSVILKAIKDSTINSLSGDISNLTIQELFYDTIYSAADAYGNASVSDYTIDEYVKVVYESISTAGGTYYYYTAAVEGGSAASLAVTTENISTYLADGTLYWNSGVSGDTTIYQVVSFSSGYLYFVSDGKDGWNYVQYETTTTTSGTTYIDGHLSKYSNYTGSDILYTYGKPDGVWYFMLYETTTDNSSGTEVRTSYEKLYTIDQIGSLTTNAADNIENATLYDLVAAELLTSQSLKDNIDKEITIPETYSSAGLSDYSGKKLGELTLTQMVDFFLKILNTGFFSTGS